MKSCFYCAGMLADVGVQRGYRIGRCRECASLACLDEVSEDELAALYGDPGYHDARYGEGRDRDRNAAQRAPVWERRLAVIEGLTEGRRLLELGPGTGGFLRLAQARGWQVAAVDPYPETKLSGAVFSSMGSAARTGPYDAVCLFDVLEHVRHPRLLLDEVRSVLAPSGCAAIGLPNVDGPSFRSRGLDWCEVKPPEHLSLPSAEGLLRATRRLGLTPAGVIGHFRESWLWEPLRAHLYPQAPGPRRAAVRLGARVLNRGVRQIRMRLPAPPPERQDYVTWFFVLTRAEDGSAHG